MKLVIEGNPEEITELLERIRYSKDPIVTPEYDWYKTWKVKPWWMDGPTCECSGDSTATE